MKAHSFRLPVDLPKNLGDSSHDGRITRVPLMDGSELFFTRMGTDAYDEEYRMFRVGALFRAGATLLGVAYGFVFKVQAGWDPPNSEVFYDWCDSVDEDTASVGRWILDSGRYDELFQDGDALAIDAYEFRPDVDAESQRVVLRKVAAVLKRRFVRLGRAVIVVHPHHFGEPPKIDGGARGVNAYRRALENVLEMAAELRLGAQLKPKRPTNDLLIGRTRSINMAEELVELARRTGLYRML